MFVNSFWKMLSSDVPRAWLLMERLLRARPPAPAPPHLTTLSPAPTLPFMILIFPFFLSLIYEIIFVSLFSSSRM